MRAELIFCGILVYVSALIISGYYLLKGEFAKRYLDITETYEDAKDYLKKNTSWTIQINWITTNSFYELKFSNSKELAKLLIDMIEDATDYYEEQAILSKLVTARMMEELEIIQEEIGIIQEEVIEPRAIAVH